ncbi:MAG TPA: sigma-70 family RNA polymerase sigma factor [Pirellulales bacterium]|nr:sigma-70 family RNA polymerase sigma factor [Pirellulales bacterium]
MISESLEALVAKISAGDAAAAEQVFKTYEPYLRLVVRKQMQPHLRRKFDSIDVVQSVWADLLPRFRAAAWQFENALQLRGFLIKAARNRLIDRARKQRAGLAVERPLIDSAQEGMPPSRLPRPSELSQADDVWRRMLAVCPPEHHELLRLKRQGLRLGEIARRTGMHVDSVRRIVRKVASQLATLSESERPGGPRLATDLDA